MLAPLLCRRRSTVVRRIRISSGGGIAPGDEIDDTLIEVQHRIRAGKDDDDLLQLVMFFLQTRGERPWDR